MDEYWVLRNEIFIGDMNYQDIERFIITRVQDLERLSGPIPEDTKHGMESLLKERSNGT